MEEPEPERKGLSANWAVREVDHLFSRLGRYTRFVLYSKWFLGVGGALMIVALVIWPIVSKDKSGMRVSFIGTTNVPGMSGSMPVMNNPVYEGTDAKGQQYRITGLRATQQSAGLVVIEKVDAQMATTSGSFVSVTAERADYVQAQNSLMLNGNVTLVHGSGYQFVTPQAHVDTQTMRITGEQQIEGEGPAGNLLATGFEIRDNGEVIQFGGVGRVHVTIDRARTAS